MKITVTASRRDDILRRKAEYEQDFNARKARHEEQYEQYKRAEKAIFDEVEAEIRRALGDSVGELEIKFDVRYGSRLSVQIGNDRGGPRREEHAALTWRWSATLNKDGTVSKESSSWSGLDAITTEQIEDLKLTVRQLEIINSMDWAAVLNKTLPNWEDYVTERDPDYDRNKPNFDEELLEADIEEAIGANIVVKVRGGLGYGGDVYMKIIRDSGSQYTVDEIPARYAEQLQRGETLPYGQDGIHSIAEYFDKFGSPRRMRKTNFMKSVYRPLRTINF